MGAKRERVQIIEVLPSDAARPDEPLALTPALGPPPRRGRRWWIVPGAVVAIAAVVVGAGLLSDDGSSSTSRPGAATETELQGVAAIRPAVLPLVPATPAGYRITGVTRAAATPAGGTRPVRQLWATRPDSAVVASWLEITAAPDGLASTDAGDRRVAVPGGVAVLDTEGDGDITITGPLTGGGTAAIASSGVSRSTLVELLASLRFDGAGLASSDARLGGMFRQVAADDGAPIATGATMTVTYAATAGDDGFTATVGSLGTPYDEVARQFFLGRRTQVTVNAQAAVIGSDERRFGVQSISFERAGLRVDLAGTAPRSVLIDAAQSTHVATGAELTSLLTAAPPAVAGTGVAGTTVAEVTSAAGARSRVDVVALADATSAGSALDDDAVQVDLITDGVRSTTTLTARDAYIATVASPSLTVLLAFIPAGSDGANLVATLGSTTLTAAPIDVPGGLRVAAIAFDQLQPYAASIHTADGRTLSAVSG